MAVRCAAHTCNQGKHAKVALSALHPIPPTSALLPLQLINLSAVRAEIELVRSKAAARGTELSAFSVAPEAEAACEGAHALALLEWAQAVCAQYAVPVHSFGACFSDGSVFCLLVSQCTHCSMP